MENKFAKFFVAHLHGAVLIEILRCLQHQCSLAEIITLYRVGHKNMALCLWPYLRQL